MTCVNKLLVLAEKELFSQMITGLFGKTFLNISVCSPEQEIVVKENDDIIVVCADKSKSSPVDAFQKIKNQTKNLKVICASESGKSDFRKLFDREEIDAYFTMATTMGYAQKRVLKLMLPEVFEAMVGLDRGRSEVVNAV